MISKGWTFTGLLLKRLMRLGLLAVIVFLGACAQISDEANTLPTATQRGGSLSGNELGDQSDVQQASQTPPLSEEALLAQTLISKPDLYHTSKRVLSAQVKAKVLNVLSAFENGKLDQAQQSVNTLIANELNINSNVHVLAGDIASAKEQNDQAQQHYQKALQITPNNPKAANRLAIMMRDQGKFEQAQDLLSTAINAQATHAPSYRNRAILNDLYLNDKHQALADYQAYSALLAWRMQQSENGALVLSESQTKGLKKDQKLVKRWLADVERQVKALARAAAQKGGQ